MRAEFGTVVRFPDGRWSAVGSADDPSFVDCEVFKIEAASGDAAKRKAMGIRRKSAANLPHMKIPCKDCPYRKDAREGWLGKPRMTELLSVGSFVCHKKPDMQCAGHMLIKGEGNNFVRLAADLGLALDMSGRELVFDTEEDCIEHHDSQV